MSKFFRSSTTTDATTSDISEPPESPIENGTSLAGLQIESPIRGDASQMLLVSMLEEKCMNEATRQWIEHHPDQEIDHNAIERTAKAKFQSLYQQLVHNQLIAIGLETDAYSPARQQVRNGLNMLISKTDLPPSRELLLKNDQQLQLVKFQEPDIAPIHQLGQSQYAANFEELGVLGKGGYGVVYHVRHKLDRREYAVKKVPISAARAHRIRSSGEDELAKLLREPRTMADLDHPNVVRYFNSWIEYSGTNLRAAPKPLGTSDPSSEDESAATFSDDADAVLGAADDRSLRRITTVSDEANNPVDVLFEHSTSEQSVTLSKETAHIPSSITQSQSVATGDSSDVFESKGIEDKALALPSAEPCYYVHLQMGLYPMSLADFLSPDAPPLSLMRVSAVRHCFHLQPTLGILLAVVNGLLYLHGKGIVHGDLKPANILMAPNENPRDRRSSVDLMLCNECRAAGHAHPISLDVRIGDFGLATALDKAPDAKRRMVGGTAMYRPEAETINDNNAHLDIFALGIVAFELLWKFTTKMERLEALNGLKRANTFPAGGKESVADCRIQKCIVLLLNGGVTLTKLRQDLLALQDAYLSKGG